MKRLLPLIALLGQLCFAADLTGHWVANQGGPNGRPREVSIWLKSDGDSFTGYLWNERQGNQPIVDGKVDGDKITFTLIGDNYGRETRQECTGTITAGGLTVRLPGGRGGRAAANPTASAAGAAPPTGAPPATARAGRAGGGFRGGSPELLAKRVSTDPPPPMPAKIALGPPPEVKWNGLAKTPPMGWNSWNKFRDQVSDVLVRETADAMVRTGMRDAGYVYLNIDDTWEGSRDPRGNIQTNDRFPNMKAMIDYVHSQGLKFGIYSSPGPKTCAGYEGSFQHEDQDAKTYASWGVDYLKYDWCSAGAVYQASSMPAVYAKMGQALLNSGRPIVFSLCQYGVLKVQDWGAAVGGNLWRTTGDIRDSWDSMSRIGFDQQADFEPASGAGHWNDPDMLEIGNGGMSDAEYRTHMSLWSILAAPLLSGNDLRSASPEILAILTNKEVIAIDQDTLGKQGHRLAKDGDQEIWARQLAGGDWAVGLFNRGDSEAKMTVRPSDLGIAKFARVRDLWAHSDIEPATEFSAQAPSHGVVMLRITPGQ
jgi:alpha-galactosidase